MSFRDPAFPALVGSIVSQQLSTKVARVIYDRLVAAMPGGELTPSHILKVRPEKLRELGLSGRKIEYIRDMARHTSEGSLDFAALPSMNDDEVIECLTKVKGVGVWTAHMFLMFSLRRPNVLAVGDLGIRTAIKRAYKLDELPTPAQVEELATSWHPYCTAACWYLWRSLEGPAEAL
jgi:DNA-3-methyladenine glycosylase II